MNVRKKFPGTNLKLNFRICHLTFTYVNILCTKKHNYY